MCNAVNKKHRDDPDWWGEAAYERAGQLAAVIPDVVPRVTITPRRPARGPSPAPGSPSANSDVADTIRTAIADVLRLPHPAVQALAPGRRPSPRNPSP